MEHQKLAIAVVGTWGSGKTSYISRVCMGIFEEEVESTMGSIRSHTDIRVDNIDVEIELWDTSGQERYRPFALEALRRCDGGLIVFECSNDGYQDALDLSRLVPRKPFVFIANKSERKLCATHDAITPCHHTMPSRHHAIAYLLCS